MDDDVDREEAPRLIGNAIVDIAFGGLQLEGNLAAELSFRI